MSNVKISAGSAASAERYADGGLHERAHPRLRVVGPPTAGTFGDPLGTLYIAPQIARVVPGMLADLGVRVDEDAAAPIRRT